MSSIDTSAVSAAADAAPSEAGATTVPLSRVHIGALDGVRGIAAVMVLAYHFGIGAMFLGLGDYWLVKLSAFGWAGVDLFFVLSGFLITGILYDSRHAPGYFRNFYARRALRIFPLYYLAIFVAVMLMAFWAPLQEKATDGVIWVVFYLSNIAIAVDGWLAIPEILSHYWTLAVEEQFYLIWPLVVLWGTRRQLMWLAVAIAVFALVLRIGLALAGTDSTAIFVLTPTRFDALAIGAWCALAVRGPGGVAALARPAAIAMVAGGAAVVAIVIARGTLGHYDRVMETVGFSAIAIACGGGILTGMIWGPLKAFLNAAPLRWLGRYSYGIYVWHYLVYLVFYEMPVVQEALGVRGEFGALLYLVFSIALVIAIAVVSYHFWERPFLEMKKYFAYGTPAPPHGPAGGRR